MFGGELLPRDNEQLPQQSDPHHSRNRRALELENALFFSPRRQQLSHSSTLLVPSNQSSPYKRLKTTKTPPKFEMSGGSTQQNLPHERESTRLEAGVEPFRSSPSSVPFSPLPSRFRSPVHNRSESYASTQTPECRPEFASFRISHGRLRRRRQAKQQSVRNQMRTEPVTLFADPDEPPSSPPPLIHPEPSEKTNLPPSPRPQQSRGPEWTEVGQPNVVCKTEPYSTAIPSGLSVELEKLASKLGLSPMIKRRSHDLFSDVINHSAIIDGDLRCALSACVYFACRQESCPFDVHEIAFHLDISPMDVEKYARTVGVILGLNFQPITVKDVMRRVCSKLGISSHLIAASEHVADAILNLPIKPQPTIYICASAVRLVCQRQTIISCMYTAEKVADVANICVNRLKTILEDLYPHAESLLPPWLASPRCTITLMSPLKNTYPGNNKSRSFLGASPIFGSSLTSPTPFTMSAPSPFSPAPLPSKLCPPGSPSAFRKLSWSADGPELGFRSQSPTYQTDGDDEGIESFEQQASSLFPVPT
eukprot:gb/GEZN01004510.1/.p1 GENE.gb/GEZN01004510.1/~~gb/GEZN01004510.1/.p1  ORF type:complete len:536 (-),score=29.60 gb/GEZN01004510.1/:266-1873(-)